MLTSTLDNMDNMKDMKDMKDMAAMKDTVVNLYVYKYIVTLLLTYLSARLSYKWFNLDRVWWDSFTRVISTINALICFYVTVVTVELSSDQAWMQFYYRGNDETRQLFMFMPAYLFVDGTFQVIDLIETSKNSRTGRTDRSDRSYKWLTLDNAVGLIHHGVGSLGMWMIISTCRAYAVGLYYAATELSTPFLNLSWGLNKAKVKDIRLSAAFCLFALFFFIFRIASIPVLHEFIDDNWSHIYELPLTQYIMIVWGTRCLTILNLFWFYQIVKKILCLAV